MKRYIINKNVPSPIYYYNKKITVKKLVVTFSTMKRHITYKKVASPTYFSKVLSIREIKTIFFSCRANVS